MRIYLKNNPATFHWNDGALGFFEEVTLLPEQEQQEQQQDE